MREIPVYKAEASVDGLAEKVKASAFISYASVITPAKHVDMGQVIASLSPDFLKAHAGVKDGDLYPTNSVLVSSNWNLNDDVFDKYETYIARHTPAHKPTNLGHDEHELVGHMTDNWVIDDEGKIIAEGTEVDDLPDLFHIVNSAVIYTVWQDEKLVERTQKLIAEIEAGTKFVSMEARFSNFGYAVIDPDGQQYSLARNAETAFLTKHLRVYGGTGKYEGYRVGRVLQNITFTAKGYVDRPANKGSIIFPATKLFSFSQATSKNPFSSTMGVSIIEKDTLSIASKGQESTNMSEILYKEQAQKAEARVQELEKAVEALREQSTKAGIKAIEDKAAALTQQVTTLTTERDTLATAKAKAEEAKTVAEAKVTELTKANDELKVQVTKVEAAAKAAKRVAQLVEAGSSTEDATVKVQKFETLSDEQWQVVAESLVASIKAIKTSQAEDDKEKKKKEEEAKSAKDKGDKEKDSADADTDVLDKAKAEEQAALAAAGEAGDDGLAQVRIDLQKAIASRLGRDEADTNKAKK